MSRRFLRARTREASGRLLWALLVLAGACQTVGGPRVDGRDATLPTVVVEAGEISGEAQREADRLLETARASFEARRFFEVLRTAESLLDSYPASRASGEALRLMAISRYEVGEMAEAEEAAERYLALLPPGDPRSTEMRLLQGRALAEDPAARLDRLLRIDSVARPAEVAEAAMMVRSAADSLQVDTLQSVVQGVAGGGPLIPVAEARLAVSLLEWGRAEVARLHARRAIDAGVGGVELEWARGVLAGELPEGRGRVTSFTIGLVLPIGGPPALAEYATLIREGVEVAVATVLGEEYTVTTVVGDDQGDPMLVAEIVREMEAEGVVGIVGPLLDDVLFSAGDARTRPLPLVSPTARSGERAGEAVYSLEGADPSAAEKIAEYGATRAFQRVAMLYPDTPASQAEADAFEARARELGMPVVGRFEYQLGATSFEGQIIGARNALRRDELAALRVSEGDTLHVEALEPVALFMPIPPEDVELLAPQVVHHGLDTLAIEVLGTSGWTDPQTLAAVDTRLTTGVVATAPAGTGPAAEGMLRFRQAYEQHFQRSLVSPTPAAGYDATLLLLEALRRGRVEPEQLRAELDRLEDVRGATGIFTVRDGRVVRQTEVVRIEEGVPVPIDPPLSPSDGR